MESDILKEMGRRIRKARKAVGLTQIQLAEQLGADQSTLSDWENGITSIRAIELPQLAKILNVSILYFFEDEDSTPQAHP